MPSRLKNSEAYNERNLCICSAGGTDVHIENDYGNRTQRAFAGRVHNSLHHCVPEKGIVSHLYIRVTEWNILWLCHLVDTLSVCLDRALGRDHAASTENAEKNCTDCLYGCVCTARIPVWNIVCTVAGTFVRTEFQGNGGVGDCRISVGLYSRCQQFLLRDADCADRIYFAAL